MKAEDVIGVVSGASLGFLLGDVIGGLGGLGALIGTAIASVFFFILEQRS